MSNTDAKLSKAYFDAHRVGQDKEDAKFSNFGRAVASLILNKSRAQIGDGEEDEMELRLTVKVKPNNAVGVSSEPCVTMILAACDADEYCDDTLPRGISVSCIET